MPMGLCPNLRATFTEYLSKPPANTKPKANRGYHAKRGHQVPGHVADGPRRAKGLYAELLFV